MSINDKSPMIGANQGTDVYPGLQNPTARNVQSNPLKSNFVDDPTSDEMGAGASNTFRGGQDARKALRSGAGVVEARPGIIDSADIDPLNEHSNDRDGWANASSPATGPGSTTDNAKGFATTAFNTATGVASTAAHTAVGGTKFAYGTAMDDQETARAGTNQVNERGIGSWFKE